MAPNNAVPRPQVDVVVLTWNDGPMLDVAVGSVLATVGVDVNVFVIDNASSPPAETVDDPRVHLIRNEQNRGVAGGRNQGIPLGSAPIVMTFDSDARMEPTSIQTLLAPFATDPTIGMTVPVFVDQAPEASAGLAPTVRRKLARGAGRTSLYDPAPGTGVGPWWDVDFGIGATQVMRRVTYEDVGGIDETIFWADDADFCLRARRRGWRVVQVDGSGIVHPPRRTNRQAFSRRGLSHAWAVGRFLWRHRGGVSSDAHR